MVEVGAFKKGWVSLSANFRRKGTSPTNICWYQKTIMMSLCAIKISAVCCIVFVTKHECDRQTDRRTDGQNYDPKTALV